MKLKIILTAATITALLFISPYTSAQGCCGGGGGSCSKNNSSASASNTNKYATNRGTVKQVGKYNIEMMYLPLMAQNPITFYLMSKKGKPVNDTTIKGKSEFTFADGSTEKFILENIAENGYAAQLKNKTKSFVCLVTFTIKGENITARFESDKMTTKAIY